MITDVSRTKKSLAQKIRDIHRRGVEREIFLRFAGALDPINIFLRALAEKRRDFIPQFGQPPIAFHQFLAGVLVLADLDQFADRFAQALNRQSHIVLHQIRPANAQLRPARAVDVRDAP